MCSLKRLDLYLFCVIIYNSRDIQDRFIYNLRYSIVQFYFLYLNNIDNCYFITTISRHFSSKNYDQFISESNWIFKIRDFVSRKVNRLTSPCRLNPDKTSGMQHFILVNYENRIQVENYYEMNTRDHAILDNLRI